MRPPQKRKPDHRKSELATWKPGRLPEGLADCARPDQEANFNPAAITISRTANTATHAVCFGNHPHNL